MKKKDSQILHFVKRMKERFDIVVNDDILKSIKNQVSSPNTRYTKQSNRVRRYDMTIAGNKMIVVYDDERQCPTTCLYPEAA